VHQESFPSGFTLTISTSRRDEFGEVPAKRSTGGRNMMLCVLLLTVLVPPSESLAVLRQSAVRSADYTHSLRIRLNAFAV